jgi:hypothetical protein
MASVYCTFINGIMLIGVSMPLVESEIAAKLEPEIFNNLKEAIPPPAPEQSDMLQKMAGAIAKAVAKVLVAEMTQNAQVMPGQAIVGVGGGVPGPVSGATVSPGKIL